jgi:hypothetical protein
MAQTWPSKAPTEVVERRWTVPVDDDDGLSSFARSASGVTIDSYSTEGDDAVLVLSAGTNGATATITLTASTVAIGNTVRDVCGFALRKIVGNGVDPDDTELTDARERLSDMLATWKAQGADVGVPLPLANGDTLNCPDEFVSAIKNNLIIELADLYDTYVPSPRVVSNAMRGLQMVKSTLLSKDRAPAVYY